MRLLIKNDSDLRYVKGFSEPAYSAEANAPGLGTSLKRDRETAGWGDNREAQRDRAAMCR